MQTMEDQLGNFFNNAKQICLAMNKDKRKPGHEEFQNLIEGSFDIILQPQVLNQLAKVFDTNDENEQRVFRLYEAELNYFNKRFDDVTQLTGQELEHGLENAKTIKESLEKFLEKWGIKIPKWLKGILDVINELLSIAKTI